MRCDGVYRTGDRPTGFAASPQQNVFWNDACGVRATWPRGLTLTRDETELYVANGLSDDLSIIDTKTRRVIKSVPVGLISYGILIDD